MKPNAIVSVEVVYSSTKEATCVRVEVKPGTTLEEAIERSRLHKRYPEIDLSRNKVGVFGTIVPVNTEVRSGDRIEIYRPITCDPETVPRRDVDGAERPPDGNQPEGRQRP